MASIVGTREFIGRMAGETKAQCSIFLAEKMGMNIIFVILERVSSEAYKFLFYLLL